MILRHVPFFPRHYNCMKTQNQLYLFLDIHISFFLIFKIQDSRLLLSFVHSYVNENLRSQAPPTVQHIRNVVLLLE